MRPNPSLSGLALAALLTTLLAGSAVAVAAGSPVTDVAQATNETATNATENGTTAAEPANVTVGNLTVWTAPTGRHADLTTPRAVQRGLAADWLTRNRTVAVNGTLVFALRAPELAGEVAATNGSRSDTAAFLRLVDRSSTDEFRMEQTPETTRTMVDEKLLNLSATQAADAIRVVPDERNGTLYVALRLDRAVLDRGYPSDDSVDADEGYDVTVAAGDASSTTEVGIVRPPLAFDTDAGSVVRFGTEPCGLVTGRAYPGADVELDVDVRYPESSSFEVETTTRTADDGRFASCVNTTELPSNATLRLTGDGFRGAVRGVVGSGDLTSMHFADQNATNATVQVDATFEDPGFVALYRASSIDELTPPNESDRRFPPGFGPVLDRSAAKSRLVGVSERREPGADTVPVELTGDLNGSTRLLAVVHYDRDEDGEFDYLDADFPPRTAGGTPVADDATVWPVGRFPLDLVSPDGTTDAPPATATAGSATPTASAGEGAGFGPVVAVLEVIASGLLARRRA